MRPKACVALLFLALLLGAYLTAAVPEIELTGDTENGAHGLLDPMLWQAEELGSTQRGLLQGPHGVQTMAKKSAVKPKPKPKGHIKHNHGRKLMTEVEPTLDAENGAGVPLDQLSWQADVLGSVQRGLLQGAHRVQTVVRNSAAKPKPKGHIKHTHGRKLMSEVERAFTALNGTHGVIGALCWWHRC